MITKNEVLTLNLSPTKKDFVQIWNELLEVAGKLSERWDPTSTNESDPGIVLLKALTGIADKLNYNIDKNILEAFMPTAAQEDSMRKLCEMMGYNIKYLQSATTNVTIRYSNPSPSEEEDNILKMGLALPKFTTLSSANDEISYFTTNQLDLYISKTSPKITVECMEGQVVKCESLNKEGIITINQLTDNNRFYLPEIQIAENGVFVYNVARGTNNSLVDGNVWKRVDNLNTQSRMSYVFKFGYDSYEGRPYIEFPDDVSELISDGLFIYYTRTRGVNGNISPRTLTQISLPVGEPWNKVSTESFTVENTLAANNGSNIETINDAYNNFKKTIGTFETLVTCRDYMNKIYSMVSSDNRPYVSNILVTDIRNDLNRAITICSCDDSGICYKEKPLTVRKATETYKPVFNAEDKCWYIGLEKGPIKITTENKANYISDSANKFNAEVTGIVSSVDDYWVITQNTNVFKTNLSTMPKEENLIDHFDLVFYPYKNYNQITSNVKDILPVYENSFKYSESNLDVIKSRLSENKDIAHNITKPRPGDILSINNYLRLNAFIATTTKITVEEGEFIIDKIKVALANAFNMRKLDFGEEIPFDSILDVIEHADPRIKVASLAEPTLYTTYSVLSRYKLNMPQISEYAVASKWLANEEAKELSRLFEEELSLDYTCADFFFQKHTPTDKYLIYTFIDGVKKYLCAYQTDPTRDQDAFISYESLDESEDNLNDLATKYPNKSFLWSFTTQSKTLNKKKVTKTLWSTLINDKEFFLGAYNKNTYIALSSMSWLDSAETFAFEYTANFCASNNIPSVAGSISPEVISADKIQESISYKLFVYQEGLDDEKNKVLYALPVSSADNKYLCATDEPHTPVTTLQKHYLFNTDEAKIIYNKLALRNVLAGRVPLFNYDSTFSTSFSESTYLVTVPVTKLPDELPEAAKSSLVPTREDPFKIYYYNNDNTEGLTIYAGQLIEAPEGLLPIYTKTYNPYKTVITGGTTAPIKELETFCEIKNSGADDANANKILNVELTDNEAIKFRAPNFITTTTYPAYVNYHLKLKDPEAAVARAAEGISLKALLDKDLSKFSPTGAYTTNWEKAFNFFSTDSDAKQKNLVKTFTMTLPVSYYVPMSNDVTEDTGASDDQELLDGPITVTIDKADASDPNKSLESIFSSSDCIKSTQFGLLSQAGTYGITPKLVWDKDKVKPGTAVPTTEGPDLDFNIMFKTDNHPFVQKIDDVMDIQEAVQAKIGELKGENSPLPQNCSWKIIFEFVYIPVDSLSLSSWQVFIATLESPTFETETINNIKKAKFYRLYTGYNYDIGKYINEERHKYLPFDKNAFNVLPMRKTLPNLYVLTDLGQDSKPRVISNSTEYQLGADEFLYINYTPSSTNAEGSAAKTTPVSKKYGKGTIIRPAGFTEGLKDSILLASQGKSWVKQAHFEANIIDQDGIETKTSLPVNLHSLGANEQIEIRDFAEVTLSRDTLGDSSSVIYLYKNFVCPELEGRKLSYDAINDVNRYVKQYTLKEGEYIFYTDQNRAETAYFTNGTLVTLKGGFVMSEPREIIDIGTILDSGLQDIPWQVATLQAGQEISFTEYQYITLSKGDVLKELTLTNDCLTKVDDKNLAVLNSTWRSCENSISYYASTDALRESEIVLPTIKTSCPGKDEMLKGNGWEVCSLIELNVSPDLSQNLTKRTTYISNNTKDLPTAEINTGLKYSAASVGGFVLDPKLLQPAVTIDEESDAILNTNPIAFKTDTSCLAVGNLININYIGTNASSETGFSLKTFAKTEPLIVETAQGKTCPARNINTKSSIKTINSKYNPTDIKKAYGEYCYDISIWKGTSVLEKDFNDIWSRVALDDIKINQFKTETSDNSTESTGIFYDKALKLPILLLPDTYGVASFYVNYTTADRKMDTWIELPPGYLETDVQLINASNNWNLDIDKVSKWIDGASNKLFLNPGLNCLKFNKSGDLFIKTSQESQGEFYFDDLRLVKVADVGNSEKTLGLNLEQIDYNYIGDTLNRSEVILAEEQLLNDIKAIDLQREFYYNVPVEKNMSIELSKNRIGSDTLMNPNTYYDLNNVNNPFVISKIDIDYLKTGLQIARSSRLN